MGPYLWVAIYVTVIFKDSVLLSISQEEMCNTIVLNVSLYKLNWERIQLQVLRMVLFWSLLINKSLNVQETDS